MAVTTFLTHDLLWQAIRARVKAARRVDAAIAYFGQGGAKLLPLGEGDRVVVDMSAGVVKAGSTNPHEIEKLMKRGVQVFSRRDLHAKIVVADGAVIAGSANVSGRSVKDLEEAAILTTERSAVRRAQEFIDRICTEPIGEEYLEECKRIYRPPRLSRGRGPGNGKRARAKHAKLWLVNLSDYGLPESEIERVERGISNAEGLISDPDRYTTTYCHWPMKPKMASELELGDWVIQATTYNDESIVVFPPGRFLSVDHYVRDPDTGKERWVFHLEVPKRGERMPWKHFHRMTRKLLGPKALSRPRTCAIRDIAVADSLLSLWTAGGRVSRRGT
jgi:hypothetical protein